MLLPPTVLVNLAMLRWEFGDLATWVGAGANVATLVLASVAAGVSYRIYKVESGRDARAEQERRERSLDERRTQAALVSTWYGRSASATQTVPGMGWSNYSYGGWIVNASDSPIYDALVTFYPSDQAAPMWTATRIRVVPPYRGELYVGLESETRHQLTDDEWKTGLDVSLRFRDAAGRWWLRDRNGYLRELPPPADATGNG